MRIFISMSGIFEQHDGARIDRIPDYEEAGYKEDRATFRRNRGRRAKLKKKEAIPYQPSAPADIPNIKVTKANWLGRLDRTPKRPKSRRMLPIKS